MTISPTPTASLVFSGPTVANVTLETLVDEIVAYVRADAQHGYRISIGSDSAARPSTRITTAVVIRRIGNGGRYFVTKTEERQYQSLRDRIFDEAMQSILLGQELRSRLADRLGEIDVKDFIEIHVDVGEHGKTKDLIAAVEGMLKGFDFVPIVKPASFAASVVADRHAG